MNVDFKNIIPYEFRESNFRLYSFIVLLILAGLAFFIFPVKEIDGYIDPFYSPTVLVLPLVALYRLTCYAYRKDYNRHIFKHPVACSADNWSKDVNRGYSGEKYSIFKIEYLHRYFLYAAILILPFFYYDIYLSFAYTYSLYHAFVLRLGNIILIINALLITAYVFSCHSLRNIVGGRLRAFNCENCFFYKLYARQSNANKHHEELAWISLIFIIFTDLYLRGLTAGLPIDFIIFKIM
ncbi:MAG: succinate dehydrogenase/fumarate reductase cytochrome b subunit [Candidatus Micrarchaeota archaeon]|nr:MAG: succinate dehydrogenase/fumarate reductase cytochrome b subunit [Candidatus Micrarchaeota archaeon]